MELLFSMPDTLKFVIVFVLILVLLVPLVWRLFAAGPRHINLRGRQPRLSVIETTTLDVRHRLVLVKRDNVEHLLLVGGPSDIVVESNITRGGVVVREPRPIPDARPEAMRHQPDAAEPPDWSLPPEPVARAMRTVDLDAALPEPPARTAREAMVDSMRAVRSVSAARRGPPMDADGPPEEIAAPALSPSPAEVNQQRPVQESRRAIPPPQASPEPGQPMNGSPEPRRERTAAQQRPVQPASTGNGAAGNAPRPVQPVPSARHPGAPPPRPPSSDEGNFAEMAQRLEAALRRPAKARAETPPPPPPPPPSARPPGRQEPPAGRRQVPPDGLGPANVRPPDSPPPDLKILSGKGKGEAPIDSLEDEMARMLGRPGKS